MKVFATSSEFDYSWDEVSTANWRKYCPWNKKTTHVVAVDTLSRSVEPSTGIVSMTFQPAPCPLVARLTLCGRQLRTERLITCKQSAPKWLHPFIGSKDISYVYETSYVDPASKRVTMCSTNMTWADLVSVQETVVYRPSSADPATRTHFHQNARITALCGGWQRVRHSIEQSTADRFQQNASNGREGFEMVLEMSREVFAREREQRQSSDVHL